MLSMIFNLRADPKERHNIAGGGEGIVWGLFIKEAQTRARYEKSFKEFPHADYAKM